MRGSLWTCDGKARGHVVGQALALRWRSMMGSCALEIDRFVVLSAVIVISLTAPGRFPTSEPTVVVECLTS